MLFQRYILIFLIAYKYEVVELTIIQHLNRNWKMLMRQFKYLQLLSYVPLGLFIC